MTMINRSKSHTQSLFTQLNWGKTEKEESESEGSAQNVNNGLQTLVVQPNVAKINTKGEKEKEACGTSFVTALQEAIQESEKFGRAKIRIYACWIRSAIATSVLCPTSLQYMI